MEKNVDNLSNKVDALNATKTTTNFNEPLVTLGPRLQKIHPETLQLECVYESVSQCMKESKFEIKRPSIMKAIQEKTIYRGFRWALVDRNDDPSILGDIGETKEIVTKIVGYIAKLNHSKDEILNVYLDRKSAALQNGYQSSSGLDNPVISGALTRGHYYVIYANAPDHLRLQFEKNHGSPLLFKNGVGQYDANGNLVQEFACKYDCMKAMVFSDKTLRKAITGQLPYSGFTYRELGERIAWI